MQKFQINHRYLKHFNKHVLEEKEIITSLFNAMNKDKDKENYLIPLGNSIPTNA